MAKLTLTQQAAMKKAAVEESTEPSLWQKEFLFQQKNVFMQQYAQGEYAQGGFISGSGTQVMAAPATGQACMAPMEQPGIWMVENTKRKLIYCNAERGHRGNHRFVMEWTKEHPYQPVPANAGWQTNAWEDPGVYPSYPPYKSQIAYPSESLLIEAEDYKKYLEPKVKADEITISFKLDKD